MTEMDLKSFGRTPRCTDDIVIVEMCPTLGPASTRQESEDEFQMNQVYYGDVLYILFPVFVLKRGLGADVVLSWVWPII